MIVVSASRRTDIPACYPEWFLNRLAAGFAMVRNPMNPNQIRRVPLTHVETGAIVFWTKNPAPLMADLPRLDAAGIPYGFQFTLNAYGPPLEPDLPALSQRVADFRRLAEHIGPPKIVWRYDPVILSGATPAAFHLEAFSRLAAHLEGSVHHCRISFLDFYAKTRRNLATLGPEFGAFTDPALEEKLELAQALAAVAARHGIAVAACAEPDDLGIPPGACISAEFVAAIMGTPYSGRRDAGQRLLCQCVRTADIGAHNSCANGCLYCYANRTPYSGRRRWETHDPASPFLTD